MMFVLCCGNISVDVLAGDGILSVFNGSGESTTNDVTLKQIRELDCPAAPPKPVMIISMPLNIFT
jgi:hypothetical protein